MTVLGQTFVIINDPEIAFELMHDRSAIHSLPPEQAFVKMYDKTIICQTTSLVGIMLTFYEVYRQNFTAMLSYGDSWKIHRNTITKLASLNISVSVFERV